jgi:hypothetical protein
MLANMTDEHIREHACEHVTLSVDGFLYSIRNGLHRTRPRNKFPRNMMSSLLRLRANVWENVTGVDAALEEYRRYLCYPFGDKI